MQLPGWMEEVFAKYLICEFTTISATSGKPATFPLMAIYHRERGTFVLTTGIGTYFKTRNIKKNPKVSLLFSNNTGSGLPRRAVLVQGLAQVFEEDLDKAWETYANFLEEWRRRQPKMVELLPRREQMAFYFKRIIIEVTPTRIYGWKDGDADSPPEIVEGRGT